MPKPKFIKPLLIGSACCVPVGLVVGLSVNWNHRQFISSVGSSGVKPFIEAFGKEYITQNPKIDVQVESGGTTFAIEEVAKGLTNIGNASNNPYYTINHEGATGYKEQWVNKKTFTLGWEGLVIMYKMPEGLSTNGKNNFDIVIDTNNILDLYAVFSGFNETIQDGKVVKWDEQTAKYKSSMLNYMTQKSLESLSPADKQICLNTPIIPFVRSGGNTAANSSIAFTYYSNLREFSEMTENQQHAFSGGQYGNDREMYETEESNARAWEMFSKIDKPGSMVYLTTGFVRNENNQQQIQERGYKLAGYVPITSQTGEVVRLEQKGDLAKICKWDGYNWYRPINCMIDINNKLSTDFIYWIYTANSSTQGRKLMQDILDANGANPLTTEQFNSMLDTTAATLREQMFSANATDIALQAKRESTVVYAEVYGACDIWQ